MATLIIRHDSITPMLKNLSQYFKSGEDFTKTCARGLMRDTQDFYRDKGGRFWGEIASAWKDESVAGVARISIMGAKGAILLHKVRGGTIYPKAPKKNIAIPARDEAKKLGWPSHWSSPGDGRLELIFGKGRKVVGLALAQNFGSGKTFKSSRAKKGLGIQTKSAWGQGLMMYWLVKSAFHPPDPEALPPPERTRQAVLRVATDRVAQILKSGQKV